MQDVLRVIDRLGSVGRLVVGGIAIATIAAVFYLVTSAGPASYVPAFTNLTPRQAGDVQAALASAKIPSKLGGTSDTVLVPSASVNDARVAIDKSGLVGQRSARRLPGARQARHVVHGLPGERRDEARPRG